MPSVNRPSQRPPPRLIQASASPRRATLMREHGFSVEVIPPAVDERNELRTGEVATSLAEAFEFILTGRIVRRELMASSQDEFADALRNAHMPAAQPVYVEAEIFGADGASHRVKRTLTADYGKRQDCQSTLEIDGSAATKEDLLALGIVLSQPPLEAPVLAQHTLGYLFSAGPQERAVYFKTLLEVTDLDDFRASVAALENEIKPPHDELLTKFDMAVAVADIADFLTPLQNETPTAAAIQAAFKAAANTLIEDAGQSVPKDEQTQIAAVEKILADRRAKAFPVQIVRSGQPITVTVPPLPGFAGAPMQPVGAAMPTPGAMPVAMPVATMPAATMPPAASATNTAQGAMDLFCPNDGLHWTHAQVQPNFTCPRCGGPLTR